MKRCNCIYPGSVRKELSGQLIEPYKSHMSHKYIKIYSKQSKVEHHKGSSLENHTFITSQFLWFRSPGTNKLCPLLHHIKQPSLGSHRRLSWRRTHPCSQSSLTDSIPSPVGDMTACFFKVSNGERDTL